MTRKKLIALLGMVGLVAVALSVTAASSLSAPAPFEMTVDGRFTFNTGPSGALDAGLSGYASGVVSEEGGEGLTSVIGTLMSNYVAGDDDVPLSIGQTVWRIDGEGDIWVSRVFDPTQSPDFQGAIIGGTGRFSGASGEYSADIVSVSPTVIRATFTFDKPPTP